ncbi:ABC transporter permease [Jiangella asiatica]|uniref:ABC transporter permease n=1 Tax=Jiangella asiatica TaxID=2530372 RepID=A0A4V2Z3A2_9ACTN|nr:ABC transporter permease [Jiangella asiatica]TDE11168.1 ABC transporter permease [Jiangella asiatica]
MTTTTTATGGRPAGTPRVRKRRAGGDWTHVVALAWLGVLIVAMIALPPILGLDPLALDSTARFSGPSGEHWLGTDDLGRDLLARALDGAQVSLLVGLGSTAIAALVGVPLGMLAGYRGRLADAVVSFLVDVLLGFPGLVLALGLAAFLGPSVPNVMIAIAVPLVPAFARLARAQTMSLLTREFIEASRVIGTPTLSIMRRDIVPNITEPVLAFALVNVGRAILIEGGLSFLGIGVPLPQPTWGTMINEGRVYLTQSPAIILAPSVFMMLTILSINLLADRYLLDRTTVAGGS